MQGYASPHLEEDNWTVFATTLTRKEIVLYIDYVIIKSEKHFYLYYFSAFESFALKKMITIWKLLANFVRRGSD